MLLKHLVLFSAFLLPQCLVWAAGSIDQVVAELGGLVTHCNDADDDVEQINVASGLVKASEISDDIQTITHSLDMLISNNQGLAASSNEAKEEQVTDGYTGYIDALVKFTTDLTNKASVLNELGQGSAIYTQLETLYTSNANVYKFLVGIVASESAENSVDQTSIDSFRAIDDAEHAYEAGSARV